MLLRLAPLMLVVVLVACGGGSKNTQTRTQPGSELPPGCSVDEVNSTVTGFLANPTLAPADQFQVYADYPSDKQNFVTRSRTKALAHLHARHALGERNRLIELRVAALDFNHVRITFRLTRYAPDFARRGIHTRLVSGGGTVDCAHQRIAAWITKGP